jgi:hypothetical protein
MRKNSDRQQHVPMWLGLGLGSYFLAFIFAPYFPYAEPLWLSFFREWLLPALLFALFVHFVFFHHWRTSKRTGFEMKWGKLKGKTLEKIATVLSITVVAALFCWFLSVTFIGIPAILTKVFSHERFLAHAKVVKREPGRLSRFSRRITIVNLETNTESTIHIRGGSDLSALLKTEDEVCIVGERWVFGSSIKDVRSGNCASLSRLSTETALRTDG